MGPFVPAFVEYFEAGLGDAVKVLLDPSSEWSILIPVLRQC
jgi:hypothetical protein